MRYHRVGAGDEGIERDAADRDDDADGRSDKGVLLVQAAFLGHLALALFGHLVEVVFVVGRQLEALQVTFEGLGVALYGKHHLRFPRMSLRIEEKVVFKKGTMYI